MKSGVGDTSRVRAKEGRGLAKMGENNIIRRESKKSDLGNQCERREGEMLDVNKRLFQ